MSDIGLSLPSRIQSQICKKENSRQVSGTSDASKTQSGLIRSYQGARTWAPSNDNHGTAETGNPLEHYVDYLCHPVKKQRWSCPEITDDTEKI